MWPRENGQYRRPIDHRRSPPPAGRSEPTGNDRQPAAPPEPDRADPEVDASGAGRGFAGVASALALVLALVATAAAGALWWQYREFYVVLHTSDVELQTALERARASDRRVSDQVEALRSSIGDDQARVGALAERVEDLPARFADLERRLGDLPDRFAALEAEFDATQGGSIDARATWLRREAEYYLTLANTEFQLAGRWENATTALELADDRLRALSDPRLTRVREQIASELLALRGVDRPDIDGMALTLAGLAARVDDFPLRDAVDARRREPNAAPTEAEPGLARLWLLVKSALSGIVSIERRDERPLPVSIERRALAKQELSLELRLARSAVLSGRADLFAASLEAATALLERDFAPEASAVRDARDVLAQMGGVDIVLEHPDIGGSLELLRAESAGSE
jgi:uroporphyrin-3 C-methyltransferase